MHGDDISSRLEDERAVGRSNGMAASLFSRPPEKRARIVNWGDRVDREGQRHGQERRCGG